MKRWSLLKRVSCVVLAFSMALSVVALKDVSHSNAKGVVSSKCISNIQSDVEVEKANGKYEYDQEDNIINDKYRNFYQIMVYHFCDSNGDGIGDLNGITSKLDYIKDMGYNGIWLTPIFSSYSNHKYDIIDYMTVDKDFGTVDDFKRLSEECKKRDICLMLDMVINHTSCWNEWFLTALKSLSDNEKDNKYINYYNFSTKQENDKYYSVNEKYLQALKQYDPSINLLESDLYVECQFSPGLPDLNLTNPDVKKEIESILDYWLDLGVGGFRLDAALHYVENDHDANIEILKWFNDYVKAKNPNAYIVGEVWDGDIYKKYYKSGVDSFFNFNVAGDNGQVINAVNRTTKKSGTNLIKELIKENEDITKYNKDAISAFFLSNHDMARTYEALKNNEEKMKLARGLYQMLSGTTFTYYGEEIGMAGPKKKDDPKNDSNYRTGMFWSATDTKEQPISQERCKVENKDHIFGSVEEQQKDPNSILNYMKRILQLKNENPEIARGKMELLTPISKDGIIAIKKTYNNSSVIILINTSDENKSVTVNKRYGYSGIRGYATTDDTIVTLENDIVTMAKNAIVVLK